LTVKHETPRKLTIIKVFHGDRQAYSGFLCLSPLPVGFMILPLSLCL